LGVLHYSPIPPEKWRSLAAAVYTGRYRFSLFLPWRVRTAIVAVIAFAGVAITSLSRSGEGYSQNSRRGNFVQMTLVEESDARVDARAKAIWS